MSQSSLSDSTSSSEVSCSEFRNILEMEGWPLDYDWSNADLAIKASAYARDRLIELLLEKSCRAMKHGTTNGCLRNAINELTWPNVVEQLWNLGTKVSDRNCRGDTAVHLAFSHDASDDVAFYLLLNSYLFDSNDNLANDDGLSFLHICCAKSTYEVIEELLVRFPNDVNSQVALRNRVPFSGYTPLHFAVQHGRYEIAALLLKHKANFCAQDRNGITPLHLALYREDTDMIDLILAYDHSQENCVNNLGLSHFMVACAGTDIGVVKKYLRVAESKRKLPPSSLINFRVGDRSQYPYAGYSPLHFAAENGNLNTVRLLLNLGASSFCQTTENYTPAALARVQGHEDVCRLLQHFCDRQSETLLLMKMDSLDDCAFL